MIAQYLGGWRGQGIETRGGGVGSGGKKKEMRSGSAIVNDPPGDPYCKEL
jgi:hypothetical protein